MTFCFFCDGKCDPADPETYHEVKSWVNGPKLDGPKMREQTGKIAHKLCIDRLVAGQAVDQPALDEVLPAGYKPASVHDIPWDTRAERCTEEAVRGTGYGLCDVELDGHGECPNAGNHTTGPNRRE